VGDFATPETAPRQGSVCWHCPWVISYTKSKFPQALKSAPEDVTTNKAIAEMCSYISGDPYDRNTLETIYTAMRLQF
jgi:hypothetical protein